MACETSRAVRLDIVKETGENSTDEAHGAGC